MEVGANAADAGAGLVTDGKGAAGADGGAKAADAAARDSGVKTTGGTVAPAAPKAPEPKAE